MQDRNGSDSAYLVPGTWYPASEPVRRRGPNTEHRRPSPATGKRAHRVCIMHTQCARFSKTGAGTGFQVPVPAPGTRYPVPDRRRGPDTEHRGPSRKTRTSGMHPDPASIRALRAIHPSPTLLRPFITPSLHYSVTSSPRRSVPALSCTFLDPLSRGQLQFFALSGRVGGTWGPSGSSLDSGWTPTRPRIGTEVARGKSDE
jgi:hypothetical protein